MQDAVFVLFLMPNYFVRGSSELTELVALPYSYRSSEIVPNFSSG